MSEGLHGMASFSREAKRGFTLIELILTVVMAGFFAAMLATVIGTTVAESPKAMLNTKEMYEVRQVMENITVDYLNLLSKSGNPLCTLCSRIEAGGPAGGSYGSYHASTQFIRFTNTGAQQTVNSSCAACNTCNNCDLLKVTIQEDAADDSYQFTTLFTNTEE